MRISRGHTRMAVLSTTVVVWGALTYACAVEDENPASTRVRDGGVTLDGTIDPSGDDAALGAPICGKYGGYDNIKAVAQGIIARASNDCRIGSPIATLDANEKAHFTECFEIQLGGAFQCPGVAYTANTTLDSKKQKCRDMSQAHQGMNLRKADFDAFLEVVAAELAARGLSQEDIRAIAPVFEGTRTSVVQTNNQPDKNTYCSCPDGIYNGKSCVVDAGVDATDAADAADSSDAADAADG